MKYPLQHQYSLGLRCVAGVIAMVGRGIRLVLTVWMLMVMMLVTVIVIVVVVVVVCVIIVVPMKSAHASCSCQIEGSDEELVAFDEINRLPRA